MISPFSRRITKKSINIQHILKALNANFTNMEKFKLEKFKKHAFKRFNKQ